MSLAEFLALPDDGLCHEVLGGRADLRLNAQSSVEPDIFVFLSGPGRRIPHWDDVTIPLLVVEVLSPSTAAYNSGKKRIAYLEAGVEEYWIVDIDARAVERWRPGLAAPELATGELTFALKLGMSGSIDLPAMFDRIER